MRTIKAGWDEFEEMTIHPNLSDERREAFKVSFYSGAVSAFELIVNTSSDDLTEEAYCQIMQGIEDELAAFFVQKSAELTNPS